MLLRELFSPNIAQFFFECKDKFFYSFIMAKNFLIFFLKTPKI